MKYKKYPSYKDSGVDWLGEIPENWGCTHIGLLFDIKAGGDVKKEFFSEKKTNEFKYPIYTNTTVRRKVYGYSNRAFFKENTITVTGRGDVGFAVYRDHQFDAIIRLLVLSPRNKENCKYFMYYINSVLNFNEGSSAINQLSTEQIKPYKVLIPTVREQQQIANFLDKATAKIDTLIEKQTKQIELLKEKRQAVISHAVTKGINPNVPIKDSGVEWLGEIPEHWEVSKLKYVGEAIIGLTYDPKNIVDEQDGILVLRSSNLQNGKISYADNVYINMDIPDKLITKENDILICSRNGSRKLIGKNAKIDKYSVGHSFGAFTTMYRSRYNDFIFYILNSSLFIFQSSRFLTTTINQLTTGTLNNFEIPFPSLSEQQQIVNYLDEKTSKIDTLIEKSNKSIELLKEKRTALISACVTGKIDVRELV